MPIKYIGKPTFYKGKTLWEIVGNLKNFGVGRYFVRSQHERYPEPTFFKIVEVQALPNEDPRKVRVWVEKVFRGRKWPKLVEITRVSYKPDYRLVHRDEEDMYRNFEPKPVEKETVLPKTCNFPPLLRELLIRDMKLRGEPVTEPQLELIYRTSLDNVARIETDGKPANVTVGPTVGKPRSPQLYEGVL